MQCLNKYTDEEREKSWHVESTQAALDSINPSGDKNREGACVCLCVCMHACVC